MPGEAPCQARAAEEAALLQAFKKSHAAKGAAHRPSPCSFLAPGQSFRGAQRVAHAGVSSHEEDWCVGLQVISCDMEASRICGTMDAMNVPHARSPVTTFWEGEIVDNVHHSFFTHKWGASAETDMRHWSKFEAFLPIKESVLSGAGFSDLMRRYPYIFMRLKELHFVNCTHDCGLTIAGFYYVCLDRSTGDISGFYYDPNSSPFQKLELSHQPSGAAGHAFADFTLL
mmetsp:Transcript_4742/g.11862  ORF Transcript_4742/g.11862 Transcript_4742/m.11862 type:complete len:228 (+) Transcript_4742:219-902(+)|eukprot:jgi/Tetstr1/429773/TSEL_019640.t1